MAVVAEGRNPAITGPGFGWGFFCFAQAFLQVGIRAARR
jgi:hypothetical protein